MQMVIFNYAKVATHDLELKLIPPSTKTRFERHMEIKVLYIKCCQTLKYRNIKLEKIIHWTYGALTGTTVYLKCGSWQYRNGHSCLSQLTIMFLSLDICITSCV
jgi:hypothetical protein